MKEHDILARQSRPQQYSTWVPKTRDWRYATGVFQHDDFEDDPKDRSAWDTMDYDYHTTVNTKGDQRNLSRSNSGSGSSIGVSSMVNTDCGLSKMAGQIKPLRKLNTPQKNKLAPIASSNASGSAINSNMELSYQPISFVVRLRFTGANIAVMQRRLSTTPESPPISQLITPPITPQTLKKAGLHEVQATNREAATMKTPCTLDSIKSINPLPLFQRSWLDETQNFDMKTVRSTLQESAARAENIGDKYDWYADAVPVNAIFPPGVPLTAKEINAYYPHHVLWKDIMLRLTNNDFRGVDIMGMQTFFRGAPTHPITSIQMNSFQSDIVKFTIPNFRILEYKGKPDSNLYTDGLMPGKHLEDSCKGFKLPSFDDLLCGLQHLPTGIDARGLTQCLVWYLRFRDSFTPRLDLNVLHTQALLRALRLPLRPFGSQNLDLHTLHEWREKSSFEKVKVQREQNFQATHDEEHHQRTRIHINLDDESVQLDLTLPLRHILTFPFLGLHNVFGEALKMGIKKAESRASERGKNGGGRALEAKWAKESGDMNGCEKGVSGEGVTTMTKVHQGVMEERKGPYRIPKRPHP
ncbi:hypothetical protein BKA66DRAFT_372914, partial [Pyrenochaeta sp. MPI-SDFR-AT-0127]